MMLASKSAAVVRGGGVFGPLKVLPTRGIEEFFGPKLAEGETAPKAGRAWTANELRLKSFDDLHKLWFVLLKEKNLVLTERLWYKQQNLGQPDPSRLKKVTKSMARIKVVIGERSREHKAMLKELGLAKEAPAYDPTKFYARGMRNGEYKRGIRGRRAEWDGMTKHEWYRAKRAEAMRYVKPLEEEEWTGDDSASL